MRSDLREPLRFDFHDVPHVLLVREHQFVVNDPLRLVFEQERTRVDHHRMGVFHCSIESVALQFTRIEEKTGSDAFTDVGVEFVFVNAQSFVIYVDFYSFTKSDQLFFYVTRSTH